MLLKSISGRTGYQWAGTTKPVATVQRTQYYPSGLPWAEGERANEQQRKYNGKEWIEAHGLDEYDSQARMYYPAIMRTTTMDPLAEEFYHISPYAWCENNPVNNVDLDGRFSTRFGAWWHKMWHGGGSEIRQNKENQYYYIQVKEDEDSGNGVEVAAVYGKNGYFGKADQKYGETITGGRGSGLETTAKIYGSSIDASMFTFSFNYSVNPSIGEYSYKLVNRLVPLISTPWTRNTNGLKVDFDTNNWKIVRTGYVTMTSDGEEGVILTDTNGNVTYYDKNYDGYKRRRADTLLRIVVFQKEIEGRIERRTQSERYIPHRLRK